MKVAAIPWRDPTFFAFVLLGLALLCSGALCQTKARTGGPTALPAAVTVPPPTALPKLLREGQLRPSSVPASRPVGGFTF